MRPSLATPRHQRPGCFLTFLPLVGLVLLTLLG